MKITKEYKFYYAHRNQELDDKCQHIHGHDAKIFVTFNVQRTGAISTLFNDFDKVIEPWLKQQFDHKFAIDANDPLLPYIQQFEKDHQKTAGLNILPFATSVENVTFYLFHYITTNFGFDVDTIRYQETRTSTIEYNKADYANDLEYFSKKEESQADLSMMFASLYEYLGYPAGKQIGRAVAEEARKRGIPVNTQNIPARTGFSEVAIYPVAFLNEFFKGGESENR